MIKRIIKLFRKPKLIILDKDGKVIEKIPWEQTKIPEENREELIEAKRLTRNG